MCLVKEKERKGFRRVSVKAVCRQGKRGGFVNSSITVSAFWVAVKGRLEKSGYNILILLIACVWKERGHFYIQIRHFKCIITGNFARLSTKSN